jgi:hypothetical protein
MKKLILAALSMLSINAFAKINCEEHQVYCHIVKNKPAIDKSYAMKLSNVIYRKAKQFKLDPILFSAIIAQESSYRLEAKNCTKGYVTYPNRPEDRPPKKKVLFYKFQTVCSDFGLSQIHYKTADRYDFDMHKLYTDLNYSVESGMIVLKDFKKRYAKKEKYWWTRYNSSTPQKRELYRKLVERYL